MRTLTKRDIASKLNLPIRTIQLWTDQGIVDPDIRPAAGKGIARLYSERNALEFAMVKILAKDFSYRLDCLRDMFTLLRDEPKESMDGFKGFFGDPAYGNSKEMLFIQSRSPGGLNRQLLQIQEGQNPGEAAQSVFQDQEDVDFSFLFLGRIKQKALQMLN
ncbi:MerR family transcriptional regulator [Desulfatibacillum aliphaticivorans]|uniref:MerR family transcriptional regulator n=1 Tax=Desulfatibacillum aliphaticivorans TaxID=218208 RepID=UPI00047F8E02|nr:MerR family transcriptional regulator [Desulfatibacillum aliphaticivorans]